MTKLFEPPPRPLRSSAALARELTESLASPPARLADRGPTSRRWHAQSLAKGAAGIAVLHGMRARAGQSPWDRIRTWLECATGDELSAGPGAGLWYGVPALAFAVSASTPPHECVAARDRLDTAVKTLTEARLHAAWARIAARQRPSRDEYDLVRGLTGLGAYLLRSDPGGTLIREILAYLVALCEPMPAADSGGTAVPGWWAVEPTSKNLPSRFAIGVSDQGIAHGITGPLALLALAMRHQVTVPGQATAIMTICRWLDTWTQDGPAGAWWPELLSLTEVHAGRPALTGPLRPSWCYGTPGISRAQQLAGLALDDRARQTFAENALAQCLADPLQRARLTNPALCHGLAGLLATAIYAAADARSHIIADHLPGLLNTLIRDHEDPHDPQGWEQPGLIDGRAGIAATLHTIATGNNEGWARCLLLT